MSLPNSSTAYRVSSEEAKDPKSNSQSKHSKTFSSQIHRRTIRTIQPNLLSLLWRSSSKGRRRITIVVCRSRRWITIVICRPRRWITIVKRRCRSSCRRRSRVRISTCTNNDSLRHIRHDTLTRTRQLLPHAGRPCTLLEDTSNIACRLRPGTFHDRRSFRPLCFGILKERLDDVDGIARAVDDGFKVCFDDVRKGGAEGGEGRPVGGDFGGYCGTDEGCGA